LGEIKMTTMGNLPEVVSRDEWLAARKALLLKPTAMPWSVRAAAICVP
jgi:hypothetical protein